MPKVTDAHRTSRRDQILDAALECFSTRGFQATSMADILEAAGLSAGAVYSYFPGKHQIAIAAARRALDAQGGHLLALAAPGVSPTPSALFRGLTARLRDSGIPLSLIVQLWGEAATDEAFLALARDALRTIQQIAEQALGQWAIRERGLDPEAAQQWVTETKPVLIAMMQGYVLQSTLLPDFDEDAYAAAVDRLFAH